jgi:chemotaxis protein MotA
MDISTIIGFVLTTIVMLYTMVHESHGNLGLYWNQGAAILIMGGLVAAVFISFKMDQVVAVGAMMKKCFIYPLPSPGEVIEKMAEYAAVARREGLLALEERAKDIKDPFFAKALMLVVDGYPADTVRQILQVDIDNMRERHLIGKKMMDNMAGSAPAFGMVGTLVGLVAMLQNLSDVSKIGGGMAVALLATLYGAAIANCVFIPLACKMETRTKEEALIRSLVIQGVVSIQTGDKPQMLRERLKVFLSPKQRQKMPQPAGAAGQAKEPGK